MAQRDAVYPNLGLDIGGLREPTREDELSVAEVDQILAELISHQNSLVSLSLGGGTPGIVQGGPDSGDDLVIQSNPSFDGTITFRQQIIVEGGLTLEGNSAVLGDIGGTFTFSMVTGATNLIFRNLNSNRDIIIDYAATGGEVIFRTNNGGTAVQRVRLLDNGVMLFAEIGFGGLVIPTGFAGIYMEGGQMFAVNEAGSTVQLT